MAEIFDGKGHFVRRVIVLLIGLFILAFGIAMTKIAGIGTAPISCIPATLTDCVGMLTLGWWTIVFNVILVLLQVIILGRNFKPIQVLQIALAYYLGIMTDYSMDILLYLGMDTHGNYLLSWVYAFFGFAILAFGVMMEIRANLLVVPGDGLVMAIGTKLQEMPFHKMKRYIDATMAIIACVISLILVGHLTGAREGTLFAAVAVGTFIGWYRKAFGRYIDKLIGESDTNA